MTNELLAIKVFVLLNEAANMCGGLPPKQAEADGDRWIAGIRDHNISDFTAVHMPRCKRFADTFFHDAGVDYVNRINEGCRQ